jgi:NAD(P)-dependent dehydrogenase (short-subunit alcohol dehydrogenase family)
VHEEDIWTDCDRSQKVKPTLLDAYGKEASDVKPYECDITIPASVSAAFAAIAKDNTAFPSILLNAAGYVNLSPLEDTTVEDIQKHYNINLFGPTLTGQAFVRLYNSAKQEAVSSQRHIPGGRIVNIASQAAHVALHHHGAYCASKAGLIGLTKCQASEWGPLGITANSVSPGPVWTELGKKAWADPSMRKDYQRATPSGQFAEPEEVARIVEFLVQDKAKNINGADIRLDGGYTIR